jgi:aspartyl-tRNA(Asn)/glutamyl-tRNA(Gln) amidotransferase subunit A
MTNDEGPLTIGDAAKRIRSGELTPSSLLEICLARIDRYEPKVKAWVYIDRERARREADQLTKELKEGLDRGPLHGMPIGVKDIIDVYDMPTGCGSKLWANSYARRDATCVERLRQAGALILGKTVTTAYAYLDPPVTRNPWNLERTPGGSSSGSAAAVACGMCLGALGTQTGGSIIRPAAFCGVCALKPTYGRVSVNGVLPLAPSLDHVGVMANCVGDLASLFQCVAGPDDADPNCRATAVGDFFGMRFPDDDPKDVTVSILDTTDEYFSALADETMTNAVITVLEHLSSREPTANRVAEFKPCSLPPGFATVPSHHMTMMATGAAATHAKRYRRHPCDYTPRIAELIETGLSRTAVDLYRATEARRRLTTALRVRFRFLFLPATVGPAPGCETTGNPAMNSPWSFLGLPVLTFPVARTGDGLPLAVQIVSKTDWEQELLQVGEWCERAVAFPRRSPG